MKTLTSLVVTLFLINTSKAQNFFQKTYSGNNQDYVGNAMKQTGDGGYIISGNVTKIFGQGNAAYLLKTNSAADTLWTREFGTGNDCYANAVHQTSDGGIVLAGTENNMSDNNIYLLKTDSNGNSLWSKTFGDSGDEQAHAIQQMSDGGLIIAGATNSFGAGNSDMYLVKTDSDGSLLWTKTYGGTKSEIAYSVQQTTDGGLIISGSSDSYSPGRPDAYLIKTDANGNLLWSKTYGINTLDYIGKSVQQTNDGGFVIAGSITDAIIKKRAVFLIKTNSTGDTLWTKKYAGNWSKFYQGGGMPTEGYSVEQTSDAGYIISGTAVDTNLGNQTLLIKTNSMGDTLWTNTYGTFDETGYFVCQANDGGFACVGVTGLPTTGLNIQFIKTNPGGTSGCNEMATKTIVSFAQPTIKNPATQVSSGGTGANVVSQAESGGFVGTLCSGVTGIDEISPEDLFVVCPNPSDGIFTIKSENEKNNSVEIINILGESIFKSAIRSESLIDISSQSKGVYLIFIQNGTAVISQKIIIQ